MKWVAAGSLVGWASIVILSWQLADRRIGLCDFANKSCTIRGVAARDATLTNGLTVGLGLVLVMVAWTALNKIRSGETSTKNVANPRLQPLARIRTERLALTGQKWKWTKIIGLAVAMFALGWFSAGHGQRGDGPESSNTTPSYEQSVSPITITPVEGDPFNEASSNATGAVSETARQQ